MIEATVEECISIPYRVYESRQSKSVQFHHFVHTKLMGSS